MGYRIAYCDDCKTENLITVMLKDELWLSIARRKEFLCFDCIEKRLGRTIDLVDLKPCVSTDEITLGYYMRMRHENAGIPVPYFKDFVVAKCGGFLREVPRGYKEREGASNPPDGGGISV